MHGKFKLRRINMNYLFISTQIYYSTLWYTIVYIHLHFMANNVTAFHQTINIADKSLISNIIIYFCFAYEQSL